ncbi:Hypothetical predicted protein [Cloeon dipterum]|uniref:TAZ-type domain-containing protein n=1 Tax=Cloeon dipterum TaxID=197152 RepID=A0A8S1C6W6_9INSE|nr:Hypothetical predicted protein [Cloeon dipterum]
MQLTNTTTQQQQGGSKDYKVAPKNKSRARSGYGKVWFQNRRAKWKKRKKTTNVFRSPGALLPSHGLPPFGSMSDGLSSGMFGTTDTRWGVTGMTPVADLITGLGQLSQSAMSAAAGFGQSIGQLNQGGSLGAGLNSGSGLPISSGMGSTGSYQPHHYGLNSLGSSGGQLNPLGGGGGSSVSPVTGGGGGLNSLLLAGVVSAANEHSPPPPPPHQQHCSLLQQSPPPPSMHLMHQQQQQQQQQQLSPCEDGGPMAAEADCQGELQDDSSELKMGKNKNKNKNVGASRNKKNKGGKPKKREQQKEWEEGEADNGSSSEDVFKAPDSTERQEEDVLNASKSQEEPPLIPETVEHDDITISQQINSKKKDEGMRTAVQSEQPARRVTFAPQRQQQKQEEEAAVEAATKPQKTHEKVESPVVANVVKNEESLQNASKSQGEPPLIPKTDEQDVTISQQSNSKKEGKGTAVQSEQPARWVTFAPQVTYANTLQRPSSHKGKKQPQQQKQEEEAAVEAATEPQETHEKVESPVVVNAVKSEDAEPQEQKGPSLSSAHDLVDQRDIKFGEPSNQEEKPHSGGSQTSKANGEELTLAHLQSNLHHLLHALMCRHRAINRVGVIPAKCMHRCRETKVLLRHMTQCEAKKDEDCNYSIYCLHYRILLHHWILCNYSECELCSSELVRQITGKYDTVTKDTSVANNDWK